MRLINQVLSPFAQAGGQPYSAAGMRAYRVDYSTQQLARSDNHRAVVVAPDLPDALRQLREDMVVRWPDLEDYRIDKVGELVHGRPWMVY